MSEGAIKIRKIDWKAVDWLPISVSALVLVSTLWALSALGIQRNLEAQQRNSEQDHVPAFSAVIGTWVDQNDTSIEAASTLVVAIFTMVLAWSTRGLREETERLARGSDDHAKKMDASIAAANEANRINETGQRAWIAIEGVVLIYPTAIPNLDRVRDPDSEDARRTTLIVRVILRNIGHSPASQLNVSCTLQKPVIKEMSPYAEGAISLRSLGASVVLPGDREQRMFGFSGPLPRDHFADVPDPHLLVALDVCATYRINTDSDDHVTQFAYRDAVSARNFERQSEVPLARDGERDRPPT